MNRENRGRRLVSLRPRFSTTYISQSRTVLATASDGFVRGRSEEGLFFHETRILSKYRYLINEEEPIVSAASNVEQHSWLGYYMGYPRELQPERDEGSGAVKEVSQNTLELRVSRYIGEGMHEDLDLTNFTAIPTNLTLTIEIDADFADQIETIHGRIQSGQRESVWRAGAAESVLEFFYRAEHTFDHQGNKGTAILERGVAYEIANFDSAPERLKDGRIVFAVSLPPQRTWHCCVNVVPVWDHVRVEPGYRCHSFEPIDNDYDSRRMLFLSESTRCASVESETLTAAVIECFDQARNDLAALRLFDRDHDERTWIAAAGLPMYVAIFGRDALTTALQSALLNPRPIYGTLSELAKWQGKETNDWRDEEPGKMLHEAHTGPLALLNYNPRARYYGSITTSGFYPALLGELWHWTGDKEMAGRFLEPAKSALQWLKQYADLDADGFYEYKTKSEQGVKHQAWKDSGDAVVYPDGSPVEPPIATCEEQAFVYVAKYLLSEVLWWLDEKDAAKKLYHEAQELKKRFNEKFWSQEENFIAMGLDSRKQQIRSIASNAGHCIAAGIVDESRVRIVADRMMADDLFSGWGVRTLSSKHPAYNPYSYHRGSIWPVEQATFVFGFVRYGLIPHSHQLSKAFFESAALFDYYRLPELFGGHPRNEDHPFPGMYLQANSPQAWSASAVFQVLQSLLGLYPYAPLNILLIDPHLPEWLPEITLSNLHVGKAVCEIHFFRKGNGQSDYEIVDKQGPLHIIRQPSPWSLTAGFAERIRDLLNSFL